jgi:aminopeptidase N
VSGTNITRSEAAERSAAIAVQSYQVAVDLRGVTDTDASYFLSTSLVRFTSSTAGQSTWIDLIAPTLRFATLNGQELDVSNYDGFRLPLPDLAEDNELIVVSQPAYMRTGEGLHRFVDPVDQSVYLYSQFEVADARRVYACFDQPDLKSTFAFTITAPTGWQVVSSAPTPEPITTDTTGYSRWEFAASKRMSTYITAVIAGPYHVVRDEYVGPDGRYPLGIFCRESLAEYLDADEVFTVTKQGFAFFEEAFGTPYAFDKYDQMFVPDFNAGAMENAGAVTILEDYIFRSRVTDAAYEQRANTVLHELAHMWFGDLVTMRWWDDLWLNESFAEWAAHWANVGATRYQNAWTTFLNQRKSWGYRQDQLLTTHPIVADMVDLEAVEVNFDGITYAKGASALRQLVAWVGEKEFLAGVRTYFTKYAWGNTELSDLLAELEASSGRELTQWSAQWLQTSGVNLLRPVVQIADDGTYMSVAVAQEPPSSPVGVAPTLRSHRIAVGLYDRNSEGRLVRYERMEIDVTGALTDIPKLAGVKIPDLLLLNDDDLTFAKIRLDVHSRATAAETLGALDDPLARALVWGAAWDMTRDAEMPTGQFLKLAISGLDNESDIGVVQQTLAQIRSAVELYCDPSHRAGYRDELVAALTRFLAAAPAGSDHQLAYARSFATSARTAEHAAVIRSWLDGSHTPAGLVVDTDLRWSLVQRLVALGSADESDIAAELSRDDTATGRRHAAFARAAMPTAAAKEAAFNAIMADDSLPNTILTSTISGFSQPEQRDLMRPFIERYFAALPGVWATRTNETAQSITMGLYPSLLAEPATIRLTEEFLRRDDVAPGARRLVSESRDGIERALRAQAADA